MCKLYFRYGVMNSGKSLFLLSTAHNFKDRGVPYVILKPSIDDRDEGIKSRALGEEVPCVRISPTTNILELAKGWSVRWVLVDEAQFLTPEQVDQLADITDSEQASVICYGLRTDFMTRLFPGSKRLFEVADGLEEIKSSCGCGKKATINARIDIDGNIITEGEQICIGAEDKYLSLCRGCWKSRLKKG